MQEPHQLDYARAGDGPSDECWAVVFWIVFVVAGYAGVIAASIVDDILQRRRGSSSDGGVILLGAAGVVAVAILSGVLRWALGRKKMGLAAALIGGLAAPGVLMIWDVWGHL